MYYMLALLPLQIHDISPRSGVRMRNNFVGAGRRAGGNDPVSRTIFFTCRASRSGPTGDGKVGLPAPTKQLHTPAIRINHDNILNITHLSVECMNYNAVK